MAQGRIFLHHLDNPSKTGGGAGSHEIEAADRDVYVKYKQHFRACGTPYS